MAVFVIAPLLMDAADRGFVDRIRRARDPHVDLVEPHVTLVFGVPDAQETQALAWTRICASETQAFNLDFTLAAAKIDYLGSAWYLFLLPTSVPTGLVAVEKKLSIGSLGGASVVPFDAHLTVGRFDTEAAAAAAAVRLNARDLRLSGRVEELVVLRFDGVVERSRSSAVLARPAGRAV